MSIVSSLFGGAEKSAARASERGINRQIQATKEGAEQARGDLSRLFNDANRYSQQGFGEALGALSGSAQPRLDTINRGGSAALNAILGIGNPVADRSGILNSIDFSYLPTELPQFGFDPILEQTPDPAQVSQPFQQYFAQAGGKVNPFLPWTWALMGEGR